MIVVEAVVVGVTAALSAVTLFVIVTEHEFEVFNKTNEYVPPAFTTIVGVDAPDTIPVPVQL